ncbi:MULTISPECIES: ThiF family adenylyltransferase [unclassified Nonomuraea]|uniref:ThiF family adenylyltransferase n=1 Tax=unclassified Nonomuraea TaxID=2593643 RepID=UPI0033C2D1EC
MRRRDTNRPGTSSRGSTPLRAALRTTSGPRSKLPRYALLGIGGTGSAVAAGLVSSGIGALHIADFDTVEEPNLTRQLLYTEQGSSVRSTDSHYRIRRRALRAARVGRARAALGHRRAGHLHSALM